MIPEAKLNMLQELVRSVSREELIWINGYLNGLVSSDAAPKSIGKLTILYGTETGNSKKLALQFTAAAKQKAIPSKCTAIEQYPFEDLAKDECVVIVISTQGEGEPPVTAKKFYDQLMSSSRSLDKLKYAVLALGDSSYPLFCKTGVDVDEKLRALGAERLLPVEKCDVDFDAVASAWNTRLLAALGSAPAAENKPAAPAPKKGKTVFQGRITKNVNLNDKGSTRQTYHIELETEEDMDHEPGDSIAIVPANREEVVDRIIALAGASPSVHIKTAKHEGELKDLLQHKLNICFLLSSAVKKYAQVTGQEIPDMRLDLVDLLRIYPVKEPGQFLEFVQQLNPIAPRLYSIASAISTDKKAVHITVSRHRFLKEDEQHYGLCSSFLGDMPVGSVVPFYIHRSRQFKLPAAGKDVVMVGPGTGIASFRAFLQERDNTAAPGKNWLFFGEKDFTTDFLYQSEIQQYVQTGVLQRVNLAFREHHPRKAFVEDCLLAEGKELFAWLEGGAHFYLSGIKDPLTAKVEEALLHVFMQHGSMTEEEAKAYFETLKKEDRYHKDVY